MSENNVVAIDFGTGRTKLAYFNPSTEKVELMLHPDYQNYLPSYFAINRNGEILLGGAAQAMFESEERSDRHRAISNIKGRISELSVRFGPFDTKSPQELLTTLFKHLREEAGKLSALQTEPSVVYLTHPCTFSDKDKAILEASAEAAGFSTTNLVEEPVAVGQFVAVSEDLPSNIIVLDCGAGTLHWAYMHRTYQAESGYVLEKDELKPNGTLEAGGRNVDVSLAHVLARRLSGRMKGGARMTEDDHEFLCYEAKLRKEEFCRNPTNYTPNPIKIDAHTSVELSAQDIESAIRTHYITPACNEIEPYIGQVIIEKDVNPALVVTGGCSHIEAFTEELKYRFHLDCMVMPRFEYAAVLGAIPLSRQQQIDNLGETELSSSESESSSSGDGCLGILLPLGGILLTILFFLFTIFIG